ncbi:hypothetical protein AK812_SmicGene11930 [Symbiodinium microadriaticum]|uniref:Uncharacterized protein n=1 Tax=Symbiodinium microadriaticum TaxID=2951 RepID=A0A1Q9EC09_SYMMI|nr:hypothetical protein AK812_SmicGene11930 [Symbiodinium microadriaticum]
MLGVSRAYVAVGMLGQGFLVLDTFRQVLSLGRDEALRELSVEAARPHQTGPELLRALSGPLIPDIARCVFGGASPAWSERVRQWWRGEEEGPPRRLLRLQSPAKLHKEDVL